MANELTVVLMTSRSGSSMVCHILAEHGLKWQFGFDHPSQPGRGRGASYRTYEHHPIKAILKQTTGDNHWPLGDMVPVTNNRLDQMKTIKEFDIDFVKSGVEFADLWREYGLVVGVDINFILVYRPPEDIAASLARRGIGDYQVGYDVAVKRLELMNSTGGHWVATNMLIDEVDWPMSGIKEAVNSTGITWSKPATRRAIRPEIFHG